jgi:hypothetical protein
MNHRDLNADERAADLDDHFQDRHDTAADRADERSPFANDIFEMAQGAMHSYQVAFEAGRTAGFSEGYAKANADALKIIDQTFGPKVAP